MCKEIQAIRLDVETNAGGIGSAQSNIKVMGTLYAVQLVDGTFDDGVDITLTCENGDLSIPMVTKADFNADGMSYPRVLQNLDTDGTPLTTHCEPVMAGYPKATIAQGGNAKTGAFILYYH